MSEAQYATNRDEVNSLSTGHKRGITVLKREWDQALADKYLADPTVGPCSRFRERQELLVDEYEFFHMPNGKFCS